MKKENRLIFSLITNALLFLMVVFASIMSVASLWPNSSFVLDGNGIENLKFYTWQSNLFAGLTSLIYLIFGILLKTKKIEKIPFTIYFLKFVALVALMVTFLTVAVIFEPILIINKSTDHMYSNSNLFFHLIVPLVYLLSFIFLEDHPKYKFRFSLLSTISVSIYGLYYLINVLAHLNEDLTVDREYDWYGYASNGIGFYPVSYIATFGIAIGSALLINYLSQLVQRKLYKETNNEQ